MAASAMTETILPPDMLKGLKPEFIAPLVGVLTAQNVRPALNALGTLLIDPGPRRQRPDLRAGCRLRFGGAIRAVERCVVSELPMGQC